MVMLPPFGIFCQFIVNRIYARQAKMQMRGKSNEEVECHCKQWSENPEGKSVLKRRMEGEDNIKVGFKKRSSNVGNLFGLGQGQ